MQPQNDRPLPFSQGYHLDSHIDAGLPFQQRKTGTPYLRAPIKSWYDNNDLSQKLEHLIKETDNLKVKEEHTMSTTDFEDIKISIEQTNAAIEKLTASMDARFDKISLLFDAYQKEEGLKAELKRTQTIEDIRTLLRTEKITTEDKTKVLFTELINTNRLIGETAISEKIDARLGEIKGTIKTCAGAITIAIALAGIYLGYQKYISSSPASMVVSPSVPQGVTSSSNVPTKNTP